MMCCNMICESELKKLVDNVSASQTSPRWLVYSNDTEKYVFEEYFEVQINNDDCILKTNQGEIRFVRSVFKAVMRWNDEF